MASLEEVADAAKVSPSTVSRALRDVPQVAPATRERVRRIAETLGYVPSVQASALAQGKALAVSVVVPTISGWFYSKVLEGIDEVLRGADYDFSLLNLGGHGIDRDRVFSRSMLRRRGDAVLAACLDFTGHEREQLRALDIPVMIVGGPVSGLRYVGIDEVAAGRMATEHLLELGHRRIVHVTGGDEEPRGLNARVPEGRIAGYRAALEAAGIAFHERNVLAGHFSMSESRRVVGQMLDSSLEPPTAIFAASDEMAMGAIIAIHHRGLRVPEDISVIGIDDHDYAEDFGLTTIRQDPYREGLEAARIVLGEINGRAPRRRPVQLPVELVLRTSTARAR